MVVPPPAPAPPPRPASPIITLDADGEEKFNFAALFAPRTRSTPAASAPQPAPSIAAEAPAAITAFVTPSFSAPRPLSEEALAQLAAADASLLAPIILLPTAAGRPASPPRSPPRPSSPGSKKVDITDFLKDFL
jgi:hypothetical protein